MAKLFEIRKDYILNSLMESDLEKNPITQFTRWWDDAVSFGIEEVNAMTLATTSSAGIPSARIVLLKSYSEQGFVFFTNYESQKGLELTENPYACLVFFWKEMERQVRITGNAERLIPEASDEYFDSRPRGSQLGTWASPQSQVIPGRESLEERLAQFHDQFVDNKISRPPQWGGYAVKPYIIEFWQGRSNRLHDRIRYNLTENGNWTTDRLAP